MMLNHYKEEKRVKFFDELVDVGFKINGKLRKPQKWYVDIVNTFEERKAILNSNEQALDNQYHIVSTNDLEWLIYISTFKDKFVEIRVYNSNSKDIFEVKLNCKIDKYMFILDELITPNIDSVVQIPPEIFKKIFEYIDEMCKQIKLVSIKVEHKTFRTPLNELFKRLCEQLGYKEIASKGTAYMYRQIREVK